jgi:sugar phosphate isomerase/epimerase
MAAAQIATPQSKAGIRLGFDSYSLRALNWKAPRLIDYAVSLKLDSIQLSSLGDYETLDAAYLQKLKDQATRSGIQIDGGIGCICSSSESWKTNVGTPQEYLLRGIAVAKAVGATSMRCFMGSSVDRLGKVPIEAHIDNTIKALKSVRQQSFDSGVKIAIENHSGDMQARELKVLIEEAGKDYVAACLDTGNPMWVVEDPLVTLEVLGP